MGYEARLMANNPAAAKKSMSMISPTEPNAGIGGAPAHAEMFTVLVSRVTAPLRASALPVKPAPVVIVMVVRAMMFPENVLPVPSVAELPTCQKRFGGQVVPPVLVRTTDDALAVVSVLPILNRKSAFGLPWKLRVSVPVRPADEVKQYTPGVRVSPPRFCPVRSTPHGVPAAALNAAVRSV